MRRAAAARRAACSRLARGASGSILAAPRTPSRSALETRRPETAHRVVTLLHCAVVLLHEVVQVPLAPVPNASPEDPADRARVGGVVVRRNAERPPLRYLDEPPEEAPGRVLVALLAEHRIDKPPVAVDCPVAVASAAGDLHVGLVDILGSTRLAPSLGAELSRQQWCEPCLPATNGLVGDLIAAL